MASLESSLWSWLERGAKAAFERKDYGMTRIENAATSGVPDVEGCLYRTQFWIELKVSKRPRAGNPVDVKHLRSKQVQWLHNRWLAGGYAWILLRVEGKGGTAHYLIPGKHSRAVLAGLTESAIAELSIVNKNATAKAILQASVAATGA